MQHSCPIHPASMVKWRQRVGGERLEALLAETIQLALEFNQITSQQLRKVTVNNSHGHQSLRVEMYIFMQANITRGTANRDQVLIMELRIFSRCRIVICHVKII